MNTHSLLVLEKIKVLPTDAGVYQFFDSKGLIIYVGKAKNLNKRVHSYFKANITDGKTRALVKNIAVRRFAARKQPHQILSSTLQHFTQGRQNLSMDCCQKRTFSTGF